MHHTTFITNFLLVAHFAQICSSLQVDSLYVIHTAHAAYLLAHFIFFFAFLPVKSILFAYFGAHFTYSIHFMQRSFLIAGMRAFLVTFRFLCIKYLGTCCTIVHTPNNEQIFINWRLHRIHKSMKSNFETRKIPI